MPTSQGPVIEASWHFRDLAYYIKPTLKEQNFKKFVCMQVFFFYLFFYFLYRWNLGVVT
jgi:hypothetical protein